MPTDAERLHQLIQERAQRSNLYKRLDPAQRARFESATAEYATRVLSHAAPTVVTRRWKMEIQESGAEKFLSTVKESLAAAFGVGAQAINPAIRNAARDVLTVLAHPETQSSILELRRMNKRTQRIPPGIIRTGDKLFSNESQPTTTQRTTLRRRNTR
jgi:hypothetical protein